MSRVEERKKLFAIVKRVLEGWCSCRSLDDENDMTATALAVTREILSATENGEVELLPINEDHPADDRRKTDEGDLSDTNDKLPSVLDKI